MSNFFNIDIQIQFSIRNDNFDDMHKNMMMMTPH